jgi:acyl-CoA thioester hydrolase
MNDKPTKPRPRLADFPYRVRDVVRYRDMDAQAHVNNALFSTYFESGRVALLRAPDLNTGILDGAYTFALARSEIDFLRELHWPADITIGTGIASFGNRSFVLEQAVFQGEECAAFGRLVMVLLDKETRRPTPLPAELVTRLSQWKLSEK